MKNYFFHAALLILLACASSIAYAQCAPGIPSGGNPSCVPPDVYYGNQGGSPAAPEPRIRWKKRWGATAYDDETGMFAGARNATSKRKAQAAAVELCIKNGGGAGCKPWASYYNQCIVVTKSSTGFMTSVSAPSINAAADKALSECRSQSQGCAVHYSDCTYPARVF